MHKGFKEWFGGAGVSVFLIVAGLLFLIQIWTEGLTWIETLGVYVASAALIVGIIRLLRK